MIGPQAYEELYYAKPVAATHEGYVISHGGKEYTYQLHMPEMWESISIWMDWCEHDVVKNNGEYADSVEVVE